MYTAYISVILIWCILGAVLNPEKFLPMAVGAVVIIGFSALLYTRLKKINKNLEGMVGETVDQELKTSLMDTMKKELAKLSKLRNPPVENHTRVQFHRAICSYMEKNNFPTVDKETTDSILDGDMGALIGMMNKNCGIDSNIGLGLVGWLKQDQMLIIDSIIKLSMDLGLDVSLNSVLAEIALDRYNPDSFGINRAQGTIILSLKKLFRKAFPQFPLETLDGLLQVVSEGDPRPLESIIEKLNIPLPLFKMSIGFVMDKSDIIQKSCQDLSCDILPPHYKNLFDSLYSIFKGNPKAGLQDITDNLDIPYEFLIQFIVAISKQDKSLVRYSLNNSVDKIFDEVKKEGLDIDKENVKCMKNYLLAMYTLSKGSDFDMVKLVKESIPKIDPYVANVFYKASQGDINKFDRILDSLGIISQKKTVLEFCNCLFERDTEMNEISSRLGVYPENSDIFHAALKLSVTTSKYFITIRPKFKTLGEFSDNKTDPDKGMTQEERTQMTEAILQISASIKKYINILYQSDVIKPDVTGFSGKVMKIGSFIKELFYDFTGEDDFREPPRYKKLDVTMRKEQLMASTNMKLQKILKGDHTIVESIITQVFDFLDFKTEKRNYFKSLAIIITSFVVDIPINDVDDKPDLQTATKMVALLLDIDEDYLEFILDVFSGNPYRIFKCFTPNPKIDVSSLDITADFLTSRLSLIADVLNCKKKQIKKLCALWINSYDLVYNGEQYIKKLGVDILGIDPMYFFFLIKKCNPTYRKLHDINDANFSESIRKFIEIHLKKKAMQVESGEDNRPFFFEGLRTEEELEYGDDENPGFSNLPADHEIFDTPFQRINGRSTEDVRDFIAVLEFIIKIKEGETKIFEKLFSVKENVAKTFSTVFRSIANKDLESHLTVLINLSKKIEIKLGVTGEHAQPDDDVYEQLQKEEFKDIEKKMTKKELNQSFFLQFILLFTGTKLNHLLNSSVVEKYKMRKKLNNLFYNINKFLPESQKLVANDIDFDQVFPSLFESGFFKKLSKYFFHKVKPFTEPIKQPESIFGIIVGLSLQSKNLIRNSLVKLIGPEIKKKFLNGVFGFIVNDPTQEKDMRAVMKKCNLNSNLGLSLVELVTEATQRDKYNAALSICKKYCTAARRVSAIVAMFKKDLSNVRVISERLDVDTDIMSAVLACATKRLDLLHENFKTLSYKLGINNTFALKTILSIACGNKKQIYDLKDKKNQYFNIRDSDLLEAIMFLTKEGTRMRDEHTRFDIKDSTFACQQIYDSLKKILGITKKKSDEIDRSKSQISKSLLNKSDNENDLDESIENVQYNGAGDFDLKDLMDTEDALLGNIKLLIDSSWNDGKALSILADNILSTKKFNPGSINDIWLKFPEKGKEILIKKLRGVYDEAIEALAIMDNLMAKKIKDSMKYMVALENGDEIPLENLTPDEEKIIGQLKDKDQKTAYKLGCTYNVTGFRELNQEYMICETCDDYTDESVIICLSCAEFCHAGHRLMKGNKGKRSRIVCSCGSNTFPDCPINDRDNPLIGILGKDNLPRTSCCLLKEYDNDKKLMGKKVREIVSQMKTKKFEGKSFQNLFDLQRTAKKFPKPETRNLEPIEETKKPTPANLKKLQDDENTIDKMEEEVKQLSFDKNTNDEIKNQINEKDNDNKDDSLDFEGGDDGEDIEIDDVMHSNTEQSDEENEDTNEAEEYEM